MSEHTIKLSIVIPAYNEERRIGETLDKFIAYLDTQAYGWEIIVVDDGSSDQMVSLLNKQYIEQGNSDCIHLVTYEANKGKGYAMRMGVQAAKGTFILVSDADASTPIDDIEKFWPRFDDGADIVIGSRAMVDSDVQVRQPLYRQSMGRIFNLLLRILRLTRFKDTQCGFKAIRNSCVDTVFSRMTIDGFGADCEMLLIADKFGYTVEEVPVRWLNSIDTRVHPVFDSMDMFFEVLSVRLKSIMGKYR